MGVGLGTTFQPKWESESFVLAQASSWLGQGWGAAAAGLAQSELGAPSGGRCAHRASREAAGHPIQMDSA